MTAECLAGHWDAHWAVQMDAQMAELWEPKSEKNSADYLAVSLENLRAKKRAGSMGSHWVHYLVEMMVYPLVA